jgi:hypothetical protein
MWIAKLTHEGITGPEVIYETATTHNKALAKVYKWIYKKWIECIIYQEA